jgi:hypothetical protein
MQPGGWDGLVQGFGRAELLRRECVPFVVVVVDHIGWTHLVCVAGSARTFATESI